VRANLAPQAATVSRRFLGLNPLFSRQLKFVRVATLLWPFCASMFAYASAKHVCKSAIDNHV
jgi:hypothetical protein